MPLAASASDYTVYRRLVVSSNPSVQSTSRNSVPSIAAPLSRTVASMPFLPSSNKPVTISVRSNVYYDERGSVIDFTVIATNVRTNTVLYWTVDGTVSASDFTDNTLSGSFTLIGDRFVVTRILNSDVGAQKTEDFKLNIRADSITGSIVGGSPSVLVDNTQNYTVTPNTVSVVEGSAVTFTFVDRLTRNPSFTMYWSTEGTIDSNKFQDGLTSGSFTVTNGVGTISRLIKADSVNGQSPIAFSLVVRSVSTAGAVFAQSRIVSVNEVTQYSTQPFTKIEVSDDFMTQIATTRVIDGGKQGPYISTNGGESWSLRQSGISFQLSSYVADITLNKQNPNYMYLVTTNAPYSAPVVSEIYMSKNKGLTWFKLQFVPQTKIVNGNPVVYRYDQQRPSWEGINHTFYGLEPMSTLGQLVLSYGFCYILDDSNQFVFTSGGIMQCDASGAAVSDDVSNIQTGNGGISVLQVIDGNQINGNIATLTMRPAPNTNGGTEGAKLVKFRKFDRTFLFYKTVSNIITLDSEIVVDPFDRVQYAAGSGDLGYIMALPVGGVFPYIKTPGNNSFQEASTLPNLGGSWLSPVVSGDGSKMAAIKHGDSSDSPGVYVSTDYGSTWKKISSDYFYAIGMNYAGNKLSLVGRNPIITNIDSIWTQQVNSPFTYYSNLKVSSNFTNQIFTNKLVDDGPYISTDGGSNWTLKQNNILFPERAYVSSVDIVKNNPNIMICTTRRTGGAPNEGYIYVSKNAGDTWTALNIPLKTWDIARVSPDAFAILGATTIRIVAGTLTDSFSIDVFLRNDNTVDATTYTISNLDPIIDLTSPVNTESFQGWYSIKFGSSSVIKLLGFESVTRIETTVTSNLTCISASTNGTYVLVGTQSSKPYLSTDGGQTYSIISSLPDGYWSSVVVSTNADTMVCIRNNASNEFYRSVNKGITWVRTNPADPTITWSVADLNGNGSLVSVGGTNSTCYKFEV